MGEFKKQQADRFLKEQAQRVGDMQKQMSAANAAVETARNKNLAEGQKTRTSLSEMTAAMKLEKEAWSKKGRALVEDAKLVQATRVQERQLSHRGKKQAFAAKAKTERAAHQRQLEAQNKELSEHKRAQAERVRAEAGNDAIGQSRSLVFAENVSAAKSVRDFGSQAQRSAEEQRKKYQARVAQQKKDVEEMKSGAKDARSGIEANKKAQADAMRSRRAAERERKKVLQEEIFQKNRAIHEEVLAAKRFVGEADTGVKAAAA